MVRRTRILAAITAVVSFVVFTACGGGGNTNTPDPAPINGNVTVIVSQPGQPVSQRAGDLNVTVPAGTFAVPTTVTVTRHTPSNLPPFDGFSTGDDAGCRIVTTSEPIGPITIEPLSSTQTRGGKAVWRYIRQQAGKWRIIGDITNDVKILIDPLSLATGVIDGVIGHFLITPPDTTSSLVTLAVNPAGNQSMVMVIVPGFNGQTSDFQSVAEMIVDQYTSTGDKYSKAVGLRYDYRRHPADSAPDLARLIENLRQTDGFSYISILAHSAGVIVTRDMLEYRRCDAPIACAYLLSGPNNGTVWANVADAIRGLEEYFLGRPATSATSILATFGDPIVADLTPDSLYLRNLNKLKGGRALETAYFTVGGERDTVVSESSGRANNVPFEQMTTSVVNRWSLDDDHSSMLDTPDGRARLLTRLFVNDGAFVHAVIDPDYEVNAETDGWHYSVIVTSGEDDWISVDSIEVEIHDANNVWTSLRYVTGLGELVGNYTNLSLQVAPHSSQTVPIHEWVDENHTPIYQAPIALQARIHSVLVKYTVRDRQLAWSAGAIRLYHDNIHPIGWMPRSQRRR